MTRTRSSASYPAEISMALWDAYQRATDERPVRIRTGDKKKAAALRMRFYSYRHALRREAEQGDAKAREEIQAVSQVLLTIDERGDLLLLNRSYHPEAKLVAEALEEFNKGGE